MSAAIVLVLGIAIFWLLHFIVQFCAALTLIALISCLFFLIATYGLIFLGFYFIFGQAYIGWSIFGAMFAGSLIVSRVLRKARGIWAPNYARHSR